MPWAHPATTRSTNRNGWPSSTAERFAIDHTSIDDAFMERLRASFTDPEIFDLTVCLSAFLGLGRTLRALGITETSLTDV